jgi:L-ascorbate oxidase
MKFSHNNETFLIQDIINLDNENKLKRNLENPPFKDTIQIPSGGYTIIKFHANNPGYWV